MSSCPSLKYIHQFVMLNLNTCFYFFKCSTIVGSTWSFGVFIPATRSNDLRFRRISIPDVITTSVDDTRPLTITTTVIDTRPLTITTPIIDTRPFTTPVTDSEIQSHISLPDKEFWSIGKGFSSLHLNIHLQRYYWWWTSYI